MTDRPILYSFRRCPYAMRARLAIASAGIAVELREVKLRDKPQALLDASPKATVPVVVDTDGTVIEESIDVMRWALSKTDPEGWLAPLKEEAEAVEALIAENDGPFKRHLDRYKYPARFPDENPDPTEQRDAALGILAAWDGQIASHSKGTDIGWLFGPAPTLADMALLPFVRQFAHVDSGWFKEQHLPNMQVWLKRFLISDRFAQVMDKYDPWEDGAAGVSFPPVKAAA